MTSGLRRLRAVAAVCVVVTTTGAGMRGSAATAANHAPGRPTALRVDEAVSPLWVKGALTFGWIPHDIDRDEIQTAYRIVVANEPTDDPKSDAIVFDSGRVASTAEAFVKPSGLHLAPDHRYWWSVQTWDRAETASLREARLLRHRDRRCGLARRLDSQAHRACEPTRGLLPRTPSVRGWRESGGQGDRIGLGRPAVRALRRRRSHRQRAVVLVSRRAVLPTDRHHALPEAGAHQRHRDDRAQPGRRAGPSGRAARTDRARHHRAS